MGLPRIWLALGMALGIALALQRPVADRWVEFRLEARLAEAKGLWDDDRPGLALEGYRRVAARAEARGGLERVRIRALEGVARALYAWAGEVDAAEALLHEALDLARHEGHPRLEATVLASLGILHGHYRAASGSARWDRVLDDHYAPALHIFQSLDDPRGIARMQALWGLVHMARRDYARSAALLGTSREGFLALGDLDGLADVEAYLGALHMRLENHHLALEHYRRSLEYADRTGNRRSRLQTLGQMAFLHLRREDFHRALGVVEGVLQEAELSTQRRRDHLMTRGHAHLHLGNLEEAEASYRRALSVHPEDVPAALRVNAHTMLAHTAMQADELDAADAALAAAEAIPVLDKGWGPTVTHTLARADWLDSVGRRREALDRLVVAAEIESRTFGSAQAHFFQSQYRQVFDRLFAMLFEGLLPMDESRELVFRLLEQMRFRAFRSPLVQLGIPSAERPPGIEEQAAAARIDALLNRTTEPSPAFRDALRRAYADYEAQTLRAELAESPHRRLMVQRPVDAAELRARLPVGTALLAYVLVGERPFALAVTRDRLGSVALPTTPVDLDSKVRLFRHLLFEDTGSSWRPMARELGRILIDPFVDEGLLDGVDQLVLIPMGSLHDLPFAPLLDAGGRPLIADFSLTHALSATAWVTPPARRGHHPTATKGLALGLQQTDDTRFPELPFAEHEAQAVATAAGGLALVGADATEGALVETIQRALWVHLAAHGVHEPNLPLHSHLRLGADATHDGRWTVREILDLRLIAEVVSLSACHSARGQSTSGIRDLEVDRLGLVEALLHVGAGHVLASLLPVSDRASAELMVEFYGHLGEMPPAEALARAQRSMLAANAGRLGHPRYWAPFVLVGRRDVEKAVPIQGRDPKRNDP